MPADRLSVTFAALADPTRRAILARLLSNECSVGELAKPFKMSMPAVSKHLRVLERAGLIAQRRDAQWRRCRIKAAPLKEVSDWTERYRQIWEERLDRWTTTFKNCKQRRIKLMVRSSTVNNESYNVTTPSDREIRLTRLFNAPRTLVFEAMSKPEHVKQWWGCLGTGYSVPVCEIDFRPGGAWRFVNRYPKGEVAFHGEYREIAPPGRVVFTEIFEEFPDVVSVVTSELTEEDGKTRLTVTVSYPSPQVRDMVIASGMAHGAGISYDRLEDLLAELQRS